MSSTCGLGRRSFDARVRERGGLLHRVSYEANGPDGVPVAGGSDFNPGPFSPLMGIQIIRTVVGGATVFQA